MKPQLDIYNVVRSLVCMCLVKQFLSLSLSPFLWSLWCVTVVNRVSESRSRVDSVVCFRLVAGCRRESIPALRVPPLFLFPCSSIPLSRSRSYRWPLSLLRLAPSRSCPPPRALPSLFLSTLFLDSPSSIHFPSFTVHWPPEYVFLLARVAPYFLSRTRYHVSVFHRPSLLTVFRIFFFFGLFSRLFQILVLFGRFIGPFSFSSTISLLSIFPFPFTFNLCEVFISCYLFFLFSSSLLLSFVYSFFIYHRIFEFSSFFCFSIHESLLEFLTSCSKQEERESNEHGVEFDMTSICRRVIRSSIIDKMEEKQNRRSISSYTYNCILSRFYVKILKVINKKFKQILDIYKLLLS